MSTPPTLPQGALWIAALLLFATWTDTVAAEPASPDSLQVATATDDDPDPQKDDELARLRRRAREEVVPREADDPTADSSETSFVARGLGLQELNPEISATGDFVASSMSPESDKTRTDLAFRVLGLHFESYLDPYSKMKAAVGATPNGVELGEAYATRFGIWSRMSLTVGKFRQQFGVVNRWHKHALDQTDYPLALRQIFGGGGLNQSGFSADVRLPTLFGATQSALLQVTAGENARLFGENSRDLPSILLRYENYRDLDPSTYLSWGLTGLTGWNDEWPIDDGSGLRFQHDTRSTRVLGADLTLRWEPTDNMRYAHFEWRTEFYHATREILAPDGSGEDDVRAWGGYTSLQRQVSRTVELGVRADYYRPDHRSYAPNATLAPLVCTTNDPHQWQLGPYLTWWQSPFVKLRFELDYADGNTEAADEIVFSFQTVFAAGPHKHERY
jgi:hypothetical protein